MGVQTITTPAGEEMVIMSRDDYDALVAAAEEAFEDGADAATYAAAVAAMGPEDVLPASISASILKGMGRIQAFREWRGLGQDELAKLGGISQDKLNDLEQGHAVLSRDIAAKLGLALNLPASWLAS